VVSITQETPAQIDDRLRHMMKQCRVQFCDQPHIFDEFPRSDFALKANLDALAFLRDDVVWSQLVEGSGPETFAIWRFHFPERVDNSGFVGWLATYLKQKFGTGVFVICGQNSMDGGIFDYWGCPWSLKENVFAYVSDLVGESH
jgi:Family of unknown function (DUF6196)